MKCVTKQELDKAIYRVFQLFRVSGVYEDVGAMETVARLLAVIKTDLFFDLFGSSHLPHRSAQKWGICFCFEQFLLPARVYVLVEANMPR